MFWFFWGWILGWFKGIFCTSSNKAIGCNPLELSFKIFSVHHSSVADAFLSLSLPQALSPSNLPLVSLISAGPASLYVMALSCLWHYQEEVRRRQLKEGVAKNKTKQKHFVLLHGQSDNVLFWPSLMGEKCINPLLSLVQTLHKPFPLPEMRAHSSLLLPNVSWHWIQFAWLLNSFRSPLRQILPTNRLAVNYGTNETKSDGKQDKLLQNVQWQLDMPPSVSK